MKNKKILIGAVLAGIIIIVIVIILVSGNKKEQNNKSVFEGNQTNSSVVLQEIEFKNITKEYDGGITTIKADVYNNTKKEKNINVQIILKDDQGKELTRMIQVLEKIEPGKKKVLQTGIMGDYTKASEIEMKVLSDAEVQSYNK